MTLTYEILTTELLKTC